MPQQLVAGNIDLSNRPHVQNPDGSVSTVRSISIEEDGKEILIPTVSDDGRILSNQQAIDLYHQTGRHLGIFSDVASANQAAQAIHQSEAAKLMPDQSTTRPELFTLSNGQVVHVPPEWTDDQARDVLSRMEAANQPQKSDPLVDPGIGVVKALGRTGIGVADLVGAGKLIPTNWRAAVQSSNLGQSIGGIATDIATAAIPMGLVGDAAKGMSFLPRALAMGATGAAVAKAQGQNPLLGAAGGAVGEAVPIALNAIARTGATAILSPSQTALEMTGEMAPAAQRAAVSQVALDNRALPGIIRSGADRADAAGERLANQAQATLVGRGNTPVDIARIIHSEPMDRAWADAATQLAPGADLASARGQVQSFLDAPGLANPRAGNLFDATQGTDVIGQVGAAANVQRALTEAGRNEVGRAVPQSADAMQALNRFQPVREAYGTPTGQIPRLPGSSATMAALRLAVSHGGGPLVQGASDISKLSQSAAMRAAILQLLTRGGPAALGSPQP